MVEGGVRSAGLFTPGILGTVAVAVAVAVVVVVVVVVATSFGALVGAVIFSCLGSAAELVCEENRTQLLFVSPLFALLGMVVLPDLGGYCTHWSYRW